MTATMLGCPHCRKPIGSVPRIAGQPVSCPYCRRPFQMPGQPEGVKPVPKLKEEGPAIPKETTKPTPKVPKVRVALDPYQAANLLATRFVFFGSVAILLVGALVSIEVVVPLFSPTNDRPADVVTGVVGSLLLVACSAVGISALLLIRSLIRVGVETARAVRPAEPDATTVPKSE
jgi:hypothetical protein